MRGNDDRRDGLFSYVRPESRIPSNHPLRLIRGVADAALKPSTPSFAAVASLHNPSAAERSSVIESEGNSLPMAKTFSAGECPVLMASRALLIQITPPSATSTLKGSAFAS
jgi:hypothetical protein